MSGPDDSNPDPLFERLARLPSAPPDDLLSERVRRRAQAVLSAEKRLAARPWLVPVERVWSRVLYPALVTSAVGSYLVWAIRTAADLYR